LKDLLPHFERELAYLRTHAGEFARQYPRIAGRLALTGDMSEDPHVERLIQSFALLSSRIHKRLDDDFPLFTESLLQVLYPHYLRPFPSCSIGRFGVGGAGAQMSQGAHVPRGTLLNTRPVRGVVCKFRTAYDVTLLPVRVCAAGFRRALAAPDGSPVPRGGTTAFSVSLELTSDQASWATLGVDRLRVYLDAEPSQVSALREALCGRVAGCLVQTSPHGPWLSGSDALPREVGFADDEALIESDPRAHPAYRLFTEYFAFPQKFDFVDLPLPRVVREGSSRTVTLHYVMSGLRADSADGHLLETVSAQHLVLGCTPVVNLFRLRADPIRVTHQQESYPVLPDSRRAHGHEVHSIEKVYRVRQTPQGESIDEFRPFYSLQHEQLLAEGESGGRYWYSHRDETVAAQSPGFETELSIVDVEFRPASPQTDTLSVEVLATNRDLPSLLAIGDAGGDLSAQDAGPSRDIRLLRKPTPSYRFDAGHGALWRLVSHLSLNHLSLSGGGIDALKELLRLYDLPRSPATRRQIDGLVGIEFRAASACLPGQPYAVFVRGTEIRLSVDEQSFVGTGLRLFAQVLDHFFGLYVHVNSFTQLKVLSARTQEELVACPRRSGSSPLV
jgi:type VI secretion system protein ImpG